MELLRWNMPQHNVMCRGRASVGFRYHFEKPVDDVDRRCKEIPSACHPDPLGEGEVRFEALIADAGNRSVGFAGQLSDDDIKAGRTPPAAGARLAEAASDVPQGELSLKLLPP